MMKGWRMEEQRWHDAVADDDDDDADNDEIIMK